MRNIFDQYNQHENRLSHALLSTLQSDPALLRRFLRWCGVAAPEQGRLKVFEQSLPGEPLELTEEESEKRGLPDGCITNGQGWALVIESKIAAAVKADQLRRHLKTAARKGLGDCSLLVLTLDGKVPARSGAHATRRWSELYQWLKRNARKSDGARACAEYFEVLEANLPSEYLMKGTLTTFSGVPFGPEEPYNYSQAKRLLRLLRDKLRRDVRLKQKLGVDLESPGRGAITGRHADFVWDFVGFKETRKAIVFTQHPHLTIGIHADRVDAYITVPNGINSYLRSRLLGKTFDEFEGRILRVTRAIGRVLRTAKGAAPMVVIVQRHYLSQRGPAVHDAMLRFDPRTALPRRIGTKFAVKVQPQWLRATYDALRARRSNLQFQVGVQFPYMSCSAVRGKELVDLIVKVWLACKPIVDATTDR